MNYWKQEASAIRPRSRDASKPEGGVASPIREGGVGGSGDGGSELDDPQQQQNQQQQQQRGRTGVGRETRKGSIATGGGVGAGLLESMDVFSLGCVIAEVRWQWYFFFFVRFLFMRFSFCVRGC